MHFSVTRSQPDTHTQKWHARSTTYMVRMINGVQSVHRQMASNAKWPGCERIARFSIETTCFICFTVKRSGVLSVCCERESRSDCNNNYVCIRIIDKECLIQFILIHLPLHTPDIRVLAQRLYQIAILQFQLFIFYFFSFSFVSFPSKQFTVWRCGTSHVELNWKTRFIFHGTIKKGNLFLHRLPNGYRFCCSKSYVVLKLMWKKCYICFDFGRIVEKKTNFELNCFVANLWTVLGCEGKTMYSITIVWLLILLRTAHTT